MRRKRELERELKAEQRARREEAARALDELERDALDAAFLSADRWVETGGW